MLARRHGDGQRGQIIVLFGIVLTVVVLMVGVVIDGGYGMAQRRESQNAADFAALAGARIIAEHINGDLTNGTDRNVQAAIAQSLDDNGSAPIAFGVDGGAYYVDNNGGQVGYVGQGVIPSNAVGVRVTATKSWRPFFLGIAGISTWSASASATARGGYAAGAPGGAFPAGIAEAFFTGRSTCTGDLGSSDACTPAHLTPGVLNVPGGFGWLSFGCDGYGLGQDPPANNGGCRTNLGFLQAEIGPPANSYGCCTQVGLPGSPDLIQSLPGNKASADCSYWIDHQSIVIVAVWDYAGGNGSNGYYHIVGFTGWQITNCDGGKDLEGVWRQPMFEGPTTTTPGFAGQALAVELVR
jgi:hypothetical protein